MENKKNFEALPSTENEKSFEAQPTPEKTSSATVDEIKLHIEDLERYIAQLEAQADERRKKLKDTEEMLNACRKSYINLLNKYKFMIIVAKVNATKEIKELIEKVDKQYGI